MAKDYSWLKLDNTAKLYPLIQYRGNQNLYRFSFTMKENIIPDVMQKALDMTMSRYPSFAMALKRGLFWYYLQHASTRLILLPEPSTLLAKMSYSESDKYCMRMYYHENRLSGEFFHILADGTGAVNLMKTLAFTYLTLLGHVVDPEDQVLTCDSEIMDAEIIDSAITNYVHKPMKEMDFKSLLGNGTAYQVTGNMFKTDGMGLISGDVDGKQMLDFCRANGNTVTEYLGGLLMYSIYMTQGKTSKHPHDIILFIPINLRRIYNSVTLRNFTLFSRVKGKIDKPDIPLEDFILAVKEGIAQGVDKKTLDNNLNSAVRAERIPLMRILPLAIKKAGFRMSNFISRNKPTKTSTFSNIGLLKLPVSMGIHIEKSSFSLHTYPNVPFAMTAITTNNVLCVSFTRSIKQTDIEQYFFSYLASEGFAINIASNYKEVSHAL